MTHDEMIRQAISEFPESFELRGHAGTFTLSARSSYVSGDEVWLYTQKDGKDFCKGTAAELRREIK